MAGSGLSRMTDPCPWHEVESLCPHCLTVIPGSLSECEAGLVMEKSCPDHGSYQAIVSTDSIAYRRLTQAPRKTTEPNHHAVPVSRGCPDDCGLCPEHDQHTCLAILEVTSRCDLQCPICLADSRPEGADLDLQTVESALNKLIRNEGRPTPLQLSGGEATLHPDLPRIVRRARDLGFHKIEVDTNGLALSRNGGLARDLRAAGVTGIYLQMDGLTPRIHQLIRGRDLVNEKLRAIEHCTRAGLQVVLSVTVIPGVNDEHLWDMILFAVERRLTGINFQALTLSGRYPPRLSHPPSHFTSAHFLREIEVQSGGNLRAQDLNPIPCPDTRCALICYSLLRDGEIVPLKRLVPEQQLNELEADLSDWETVLTKLGLRNVECECSQLSCCVQDTQRVMPAGTGFFSIGFHGMMDAYNFDLQRVRRCCVHELTPDGRLIPFCLYNIKYRSSRCSG